MADEKQTSTPSPTTPATGTGSASSAQTAPATPAPPAPAPAKVEEKKQKTKKVYNPSSVKVEMPTADTMYKFPAKGFLDVPADLAIPRHTGLIVCRD